jgi:hypothetical protein
MAWSISRSMSTTLPCAAARCPTNARFCVLVTSMQCCMPGAMGADMDHDPLAAIPVVHHWQRCHLAPSIAWHTLRVWHHSHHLVVLWLTPMFRSRHELHRAACLGARGSLGRVPKTWQYFDLIVVFLGAKSTWTAVQVCDEPPFVTRVPAETRPA